MKNGTQIRFGIFAFAIFILGGCSGSQPDASQSNSTNVNSAASPARKITSAGVVKTEPRSVDVTAGEKAVAVVRINIEKGFHLNANPPTFPYLKATELEINAGDGIKAGKIIYPAAVTAKFEFSDQPLAVYEGEQEIKAEIAADKSAAKGSRVLAATLNIQACDQQVCYPPGSINLQIPVTVK